MIHEHLYDPTTYPPEIQEKLRLIREADLAYAANTGEQWFTRLHVEDEFFPFQVPKETEVQILVGAAAGPSVYIPMDTPYTPSAKGLEFLIQHGHPLEAPAPPKERGSAEAPLVQLKTNLPWYDPTTFPPEIQDEILHIRHEDRTYTFALGQETFVREPVGDEFFPFTLPPDTPVTITALTYWRFIIEIPEDTPYHLSRKGRRWLERQAHTSAAPPSQPIKKNKYAADDALLKVSPKKR